MQKEYLDNSVGTFQADGSLSEGLLVKVNSSGKVTIANTADQPIGSVIINDFISGRTIGDGDKVAIRFLSSPGIHNLVAAGAVTVGAKVYTTDDGKVSATAGTGASLVGVALSATGSSGGAIKVVTV